MGTTPVLVKSLTQVNTTNAAAAPGGTAIQNDPVVASLGGGGYVVVWTDDSRFHNANGTAVVGQRYDTQGEMVGGEVEISQFGSGDQDAAAITAMPAGGFAVAITHRDAGDNNIYVTRWNADMSFVQNDLVDFSAAQTFGPSLTSFGNGSYVVAYTIGSGDDTDIVGRIVSASGIVGAPFDIHNEDDNSDRVELATLSDGNFVAVLEDELLGSTTDIDVRYAILTPTGAPVTASFVPGSFHAVAAQDPDVAALTGGGFVVVWTDFGTTESDIYATILTNEGDTVRSNILVNATQAGAQNEASVVGLLDGGFLVAWEDDEAVLVRAQRFDALGNPVGDEFTMNTGSALLGSPDLARLISGHVGFVTTFSGLETDVGTSLWNPRGTVATLGDVLWRQADGTLATSEREIGRPPATWQTQGVGDFDGDGDGDVLLRVPDGTVRVWELENGQFFTNHNIAFASIGWEIQGLGDFDGDGDSDVIWRHTDGAVVTWEMENNDYVVNHNIAFASVGWRIDGTGDFDGDGDDDIIWRHQDGDVVTWEMEDGAYVQNHNIATASTTWQINGTGDFDGDGDADILWRHDEGAVVFWEMQGGEFVTSHSLPDVATTYQIQGTEDFDSDGDADILWRHQDGTVVTWEMDGGNLLQTHSFGLTGNDWQIRGTGEFDLL